MSTSRHVPTSQRRRVLAAVLALAATVAVGCGAPPAPTATATPSADATTAPAPPRTAPSPVVTPTPEPTAEPALVAKATGALEVYAAHDEVAPTTTLPATTAFGTRTVTLVTDVGQGPTAGWLEVLLPVRPNGSTGWVREADVELREVALEVRVDLGARRLVVTEDGDEVLATPVAIGDPEHPTPTGRFFVTDKLETPDPAGAYGPYALGLSAHSDVLTEFAGGDGQVGIHGTDDPASIGQDVSHGCVRVPNDVVAELAHLLPLGTPVTIT